MKRNFEIEKKVFDYFRSEAKLKLSEGFNVLFLIEVLFNNVPKLTFNRLHLIDLGKNNIHV